MSERMPEEWRKSVLIPIYKNKGDAQCYGNYREINKSHTMKVWKRIIAARLRDRVEISKQQYGFMPGKGTNHRCHACLQNVDGKVQGRSKRTTLCIRRPRESLRQGSVRRGLVLYEKIRNSGKVCETYSGYV